MPNQDPSSSTGIGGAVAAANPAMVVVTTAFEGERGGCLVGFHCQSGIDPERYSIWLSKANHTYRLALRSSFLGLHFLASSDLELARLFGTTSGDQVDKFAQVDWTPGPDGTPLLTRCEQRFVVRRRTLMDDGSDHVCLSVEIVSGSASGEFVPLRLSDVGDFTPGREADERPAPPTERAEE